MLQFLPDTMSLVPLFVLLIKYPDLMDARRTDDVQIEPESQAGLANAALLLLLGDPTGQQAMKWATEMVRSHRDAAGEIDHSCRKSQDQPRAAHSKATERKLAHQPLHAFAIWPGKLEEGARLFLQGQRFETAAIPKGRAFGRTGLLAGEAAHHSLLDPRGCLRSGIEVQNQVPRKRTT